jgi:hypothetical protein
MERTNKGAPFYKVSAIAQNLTTMQLVAATQQSLAPFIRADNRGNNWQVANSLVNLYSGFVERLHWVDTWQSFIAQSAIGASHSVLTSSDGLTWTPALGGSQYKKKHSGFAFSPSLALAVVALESGTSNLLVYNGSTWYPITLPGNTGYSVFWSQKQNRFFAYLPGSQLVKVSADGLTWTDYTYLLPVPCGSAAGAFAAYCIPLGDVGNNERFLLFTSGGTAPAWYSDNYGQTWTAASDMENTGSVTRYVAVDGNAVYVAFNAELNKGMVSLDHGATWERSDHLSGNASGVIALN